jgi:hypothetical protein
MLTSRRRRCQHDHKRTTKKRTDVLALTPAQCRSSTASHSEINLGLVVLHGENANKTRKQSGPASSATTLALRSLDLKRLSFPVSILLRKKSEGRVGRRMASRPRARACLLGMPCTPAIHECCTGASSSPHLTEPSFRLLSCPLPCPHRGLLFPRLAYFTPVSLSLSLVREKRDEAKQNLLLVHCRFCLNEHPARKTGLSLQLFFSTLLRAQA